jgi:CRISPR-associated protein Csd2
VTTTATTAVHTDVSRRHDFVFLFDVSDGNPNGDPDAGNLPRVDPETMQGLVTDVALKRKVRDYVNAARGTEARFKIYVQSEEALNTLHKRAYEGSELKSTGAKQARNDVKKAREWMCANFYDIRMFGAVMTTGINCGQVRGPLQLTFARSIDRVVAQDLSITRIAVTKPEDMNVVEGEDGAEATGGKRTEMGRKALVPYGLYRAFGFFNPQYAASSGATREDLDLFWTALVNMFELDRSSSRGFMACRGAYVFSHDSPLGNAPTQKLFERVSIARKPDIEAPRSFKDYDVREQDGDPPTGVTLTKLGI